MLTIIAHAEELLKLAHHLVQDSHINLNEQQQFAITVIFHRSILIAETFTTDDGAKHLHKNPSVQHQLANLMTPVIGYTHLLISGKLGILPEAYQIRLEQLLSIAHSIDIELRPNPDKTSSPYATSANS